MNRLALIISIFITIACLSGCSLSGVFVDTSSLQVTLKKIRLEKGKDLKVYYGGQVRYIPLESIRRMTIYQYESQTIERELYFLGAIELRDGTILASGKNTDKGGTTFICMGDVLLGNQGKTTVRLPLDKVSKLTFK
jgi:hypothetical protein